MTTSFILAWVGLGEGAASPSQDILEPWVVTRCWPVGTSAAGLWLEEKENQGWSRGGEIEERGGGEESHGPPTHLLGHLLPVPQGWSWGAADALPILHRRNRSRLGPA